MASFWLKNHNLVFVLILALIGPYGVGKTLIMKTEASKLAENGQKVLILLVANGSWREETLLLLQTEEEYKDEPNVVVKSVTMQNRHECGLEKLSQGFDHIMIDEFFLDFPAMSKVNHEEFKRFVNTKTTVWVAMSNQYNDGFDNPVWLKYTTRFYIA